MTATNYLLIGDDDLSKDKYVTGIKQDVLKKKFENFNLDLFYAQDLKEKQVLQEAFLRLPQNCSKRIIIIKNIKKLKKAPRQFLDSYLEAPYNHLVLILDCNEDANELRKFLAYRNKGLRIVRFGKKYIPTGLDLNRAILQGRPDAAIKILSSLFEEGQKPYFILGGIMGYFRKRASSMEPRKSSLVFNCILKADLEIKTGRLRVEYALEKLIVQLSRI